MKKYLRNTFLCILLLVAVSFCTYAALNYYDILPLHEETETQTVTTDQITTTTETTTEQITTTLPETTVPETLIDLNSLTVIDLFPLSLAGGGWDVKHCQGIAVDKKNGYVYYSYTTLLVKCDMDGNIVGTVTNIEGHLGDIAYNEKDGKLYCGYYATDRKGFYIVIFDTTKITKTDIKPTKDVVRTVYVKEAYEDYLAKVQFESEETTVTKSHKYGCSGIDGVTFGPDFSGKIKNKELLTVAYGIYSDTERDDNDYQVLLQYDVSSWWDSIAKPYSAKEFHKSSPESCNGKYFVYTGNTSYGVQTMEYFDELNIWLLSCYKGEKEQFESYRLFAIDGDVKPTKQALKGQPQTDEQYVLSLYQDGKHDKANDIYGWNSTYGVQGMAYMGDGLFYIVRPYKSWTGKKNAICYLNVWAPENDDPFILAAGIGNDYSISKKPRVETTAAPTTTKEKETTAEEVSSTSAKTIFSLF